MIDLDSDAETVPTPAEPVRPPPRKQAPRSHAARSRPSRGRPTRSDSTRSDSTRSHSTRSRAAHRQPTSSHAASGPATLGGRHRGRTWRLTQRGRVVVASAVTLVALVAVVVVDRGGHSGSSQLTASPAPQATVAALARPVPPAPTPTVARDTAGVPLAVASAVDAAGVPVSVAVYDAVTDRTYVYRDAEGQVAASVLKLSILGAVLRAEQAGAAHTATVAAEETRMIAASDNDAATALFRRVHASGVADFDRAAGADIDPDPKGQFGLDTSTAVAQLAVQRVFAYPNAVLTDASRAEAAALEAKIGTDQHWGASGGVPAGVTVALKDGWLPHGDGWVVNTVGHVHGAGRDYVVAILSHGSATEQTGIDRIEKVSAQVWAAAGSSTTAH